MTRPDYALSLDLHGRRVVVVGGGPVAARRVAGLVEAGAVVEVVSPWLVEDLADLAAARQITWQQREYLAGDLVTPETAWLVHTATGDPAVDAAVAGEAEAARVWCVRADDAAASSAWTPAVARGRAGTPAEGLAVAVTAGGDPRRARAVRDAVQAALESATLPVRRVRGRGVPGARQGVGATRLGRVSLVGGGPGADDLITVRGRALLAEADVVVADRLGPRGLLASLSREVEVIDVGKAPGHHPVSQGRINELLVHHAAQGKHVVRLKGGDPFVLGRGGEEALHCAAHGIPVEVVPGVTSAVSVPAAAGIPVTHRGITASFVVASAHEGADSVLRAAAEAAPDATLVLLMGITRLAETAAALIASGREPATPVALVERGWTPQQRTTVTTLAAAYDDAVRHGVGAPAVVVVGDVVRVRDQVGDLRGRGPNTRTESTSTESTSTEGTLTEGTLTG
jgi:uroporphyrin-III C-methyltransferase / precorrin-2 dehydrogenase / sirohydrochlorin ferrochelatase